MQALMDPSERKKPLTLNLPPMILEELTEAAWQHRCSKSVLAERAIRAYLRLDDTKQAEQDRQAITAAQAEAIARFTLPGNIGTLQPIGQPARLYTGPGHLEETGYIPEGSSEERQSTPPGDAP